MNLTLPRTEQWRLEKKKEKDKKGGDFHTDMTDICLPCVVLIFTDVPPLDVPPPTLSDPSSVGKGFE